MLGRRVLQIAVDDLEGARQCHAQSAHYLGKTALGILAISEVERRPCGELIEDRLQLDLLVDLIEFVDGSLQAFGDRQIERLDDRPAICLRGGLGPKQEVVDLLIDEVAVALEVLLINIEPGRDPEESLEPLPRS